MGKVLELSIGESLFEKVIRPIRVKEDIVILLLETMKMFLVGDIINKTERKGKVLIKIDKMSRVIFETQDKYFSFHFPFSVEKGELDSKSIRFYDSNIGINLDSKTVSILLGIFYDEVMRNDSLEEIYYELSYVEGICEVEKIWKILRKLMLFESGYLRYDYDLEHENGDMHPLNHFDIYFSSGNSFKVGLNNKIAFEEFIDILDIQTECYYLENKK